MTTTMRASFLGLATTLFLGCGSSDDTADDTGDDVADDTGDDTGDDAGDDTTDPGTPTAARLETLELRDPHLFALGGSFDVTETVNTAIADAITMDADDPPDDVLDLSFVLVFRPWDPDAADGPLDAVVGADCAAPDGATCTAAAEATVVETTATNGDATCLAPGADTTGDYDPPVVTPGGRCFASDGHQVTLTLSGIEITLDDTRIGGTYDEAGHEVTDGLMLGFISQAAADATIIPEDVVLVGGDPLSSLLLDDDLDTGPGGVSGWWFYLNFTASEVTYTE